MKRCVASSGGSAPFIGRGKNTEYKSRKDSWILNQMNTGKVDPGIRLDKSEDDNMKFASRMNAIALRVAKVSDEAVDEFYELQEEIGGDTENEGGGSIRLDFRNQSIWLRSDGTVEGDFSRRFKNQVEKFITKHNLHNAVKWV